jgi:hypothetical protein
MEFVGPFKTRKEAEEYAKANENEDVASNWEVTNLNSPGPERPYQFEA